MIRTIREGIAAVNTREGLLMLTKRAASYYATPEIAFVEIDLPAMPSALCAGSTTIGRSSRNWTPCCCASPNATAWPPETGRCVQSTLTPASRHSAIS